MAEREEPIQLSKERWRKHSSSLSFAEKLRILEKLRERDASIAKVREQLRRKAAIRNRVDEGAG